MKFQLDDDQIWSLLSRSQSLDIVFRSWVEQQISSLVHLEPNVIASLTEGFSSEYNLDEEDLVYAATRVERLKRFKKYRFSSQVEEHFSRTRSQRQQVIFSMLRCSNPSRLRELFLSIREGELDFATAAIRWSQGPESARGGRIGPVPANNLGNPELTELIHGASIGEYVGPHKIGDMHVLLRLDKRVDPPLDSSMEATVLNELYSCWVDKQIDSLRRDGIMEPIEYLPD